MYLGKTQSNAFLNLVTLDIYKTYFKAFKLTKLLVL